MFILNTGKHEYKKFLFAYWISHESLFGKIKRKFISPIKIYLFKLNNRNTRKKFEVCSKLTTKTRRHCRLFGVFIVNFERISQLIVAIVSIVNFKQVNSCWQSCGLFAVYNNGNICFCQKLNIYWKFICMFMDRYKSFQDFLFVWASKQIMFEYIHFILQVSLLYVFPVDVFFVQIMDYQNNLQNLFKVNSKDSRRMSVVTFWCHYC